MQTITIQHLVSAYNNLAAPVYYVCHYDDIHSTLPNMGVWRHGWRHFLRKRHITGMPGEPCLPCLLDPVRAPHAHSTCLLSWLRLSSPGILLPPKPPPPLCLAAAHIGHSLWFLYTVCIATLVLLAAVLPASASQFLSSGQQHLGCILHFMWPSFAALCIASYSGSLPIFFSTHLPRAAPSVTRSHALIRAFVRTTRVTVTSGALPRISRARFAISSVLSHFVALSRCNLVSLTFSSLALQNAVKGGTRFARAAISPALCDMPAG